MKFTIFSIVTGTSFCTVPFKANERNQNIPQGCQFCVSGQYATKENATAPQINERNFLKAVQLAKNSQVETALLTSRGEPTLFPEQITQYLQLLDNQFPFIELQTNGVPLGQNFKRYQPYLEQWYNQGLTTILISVVSNDPEILRQNYMPRSEKYYDLPKLITNLRQIGYTVRLACVCTKKWMSTPEQIDSFINFANKNDVGQITFRPLNEEYRRETAQKWIEEHKMSETDKENFRKHLNKVGHKLHEIENVGTVYDVKGCSVMFSHPLTKYSNHNSGEMFRNLIFFPDGTLRYDWEHEGAILLQGNNNKNNLETKDGLKW